MKSSVPVVVHVAKHTKEELFMVQCALCGFMEKDEIVSHIRKEHGGIKSYLAVFPDLHVVDPDLFVAIENAVYFGYFDSETVGLNTITPEEREFLIVTAQNNSVLHSEITIEQDF